MENTKTTTQKVTYRDKFIALANDALNNMALDAGLREAGRPLVFRFIVEQVEHWNKIRLTKKSPVSVYQLIENEAVRRMGGSEAARMVATEVVKKAKTEAMGLKTEPAEASADQPKTGYIFGTTFNRLIETVKPGVSTDTRYEGNAPTRMVRLTFERAENGTQSVTAYTCDGYRIIKTMEKAMVKTEAAFTVFIGIPAVKPKKTDMVTVTLDGDKSTVSFGNISFRFKQPKEDAKGHNMNELFDQQEKTHSAAQKTVFHVNPTYLRELARSLEKSLPAQLAMAIEIPDTPNGLIKLSRGETEIYLCPMRAPSCAK